MTPTPLHVATDELIETLERLEKEATPGPWKLFPAADATGVDYIEKDMGDDRAAQGLEDPIVYASLAQREADLPLIVSLRNHLPALISALKEHKRMREALEAINTACGEEIAKRYAHPYMKAEKVAGKSAVYSLLVLPRNIARAALQPQGEK